MRAFESFFFGIGTVMDLSGSMSKNLIAEIRIEESIGNYFWGSGQYFWDAVKIEGPRIKEEAKASQANLEANL